MSNRKYDNIKRDQQLWQQSIFHWIIMIIICFLLFYAAFNTALFNGYASHFDKPILSATMWSSIILIMLAIHAYFKWKLEDNRDLISIYVWLIPLTFWISSLAAASPDLAKGMTHIHMMYITLFLAGAYLTRQELGAKVLQISITALGYLVTLYGLACAFGNAYARDAVMFDQGLRLTSVFQYANAYAAFLMATLLCSLYYITHSKKWYVIFVNGLMIVPILLSFWLTLSRGGIVVMPFIFLAILPLMSISRQLMLTLYTMIGVAASFPITGYVTNKSTHLVNEVLATASPDLSTATTISWFNGDSLSGWAVVAGVSLAAGGLIWLLHTYIYSRLDQKLNRFSDRNRYRLFFPAVLVIAGALGAFVLLATPVKSLLPDNLATRLESINFQQHSVLERGTFYKDSIKLFKDYPVLGTGGGGWAVMYEKYQNNPYVSRQAHNFFLQYLNEVGILGLAVFVGLLVLVYSLFIKKSFSDREQTDSRLIFYMVSISILIHSILDFELSYVFLGSLIFLCLGGMTAVLNGKSSWITRLSFLTSRKYIYPVILSILALVFLIFSAVRLNANSSYERAISYAQQGKPLNQIMAQVDSAISSNPKPDYYALKSDILMQVASQASDLNQREQYFNQASSLLDEARSKEPNNRALLERQYSLFMSKQDHAKAMQLIQEAIVHYPWELSFYERAAALYSTEWNQAKQENNQAKMDQYWKDIQATYAQVQKGIEHIATLPEGQLSGRPFYLSPLIRFSVGQAYAMNGDLAQAWTQLQPAGEESYSKLEDPQADPSGLEQNKLIVRWYLALSKKQGTLDPNRYNTFIGKYPEEKTQIDNMAASLH